MEVHSIASRHLNTLISPKHRSLRSAINPYLLIVPKQRSSQSCYDPNLECFGRARAAVSAASSSLNKNIINRINITAMLSDDNASDEENGHEDQDTSTSSIPTIRVRFHKPQTAPQFQRMPLFASNDLDALMDKQQASLLSTSQDLSPRSPHRPSSSRPQSRSNPVAAHKKNVSVENRVLLKLASVLPSGEHALGRLPESRANLVKLNAELDAAIKEVRDLETVQSKFSFGMSSAGNALPEDAAVSSMEHGAVVYDAIIAELTAQATKKVGRIRRFYGGYLLRVRNAHSEEVAALQLRIEQLEAERHEAVLLQMPKDGLLLDSFSAPERIEQPHSTNEAGATDPPASPGRGGLHDFVLSRLTKERKMALQQAQALHEELARSQADIRQCRAQLAEATAREAQRAAEALSSDQTAFHRLQALLADLRPPK